MVSMGVLQATSIEVLVRDAMSHLPGQCAVANSQLEKVTGVVRLQRPHPVVTPGTPGTKHKKRRYSERIAQSERPCCTAVCFVRSPTTERDIEARRQVEGA
jgi:hypothetical protein